MPEVAMLGGTVRTFDKDVKALVLETDERDCGANGSDAGWVSAIGL